MTSDQDKKFTDDWPVGFGKDGEPNAVAYIPPEELEAWKRAHRKPTEHQDPSKVTNTNQGE